MKNIILIAILVLLGWGSHAQRAQSEYLEAKRLFKLGEYSLAKAAFGTISEDPNFGNYATFYFGLSAFKQGDLKASTDAWKQLLSKSPKWDQRQEVVFWLAWASFEAKRYDEALRFSGEFSKAVKNSDTEEYLINQYVFPLEMNEIESLYKSFSENKFIAKAYLRKLNLIPYSERDFAMVNKLVTKWRFDEADYASERYPTIKKEVYDIAVLLPFLFESLNNTAVIAQNSMIMDMYQGMLMAAEDLKKIGKRVNLLPYDTKLKVDVTERIVSNPGFENVDLIVGPLYPGPNGVVNNYSFEHKINMINPISSNSEVIGENPYSFLLKPSFETMARSAAEFAATENENKNVLIYYEDTAKDSLFAAVYKATIEEAGFNVRRFEVISKSNAKLFLDTLSEQYDYYISPDVADSLKKLPGRYVRDRSLRSEELSSLARNTLTIPIGYDDEGKPIAYYEKRFSVERGAIGHIVLATRSNLLANNLISAVETRGDDIKLYGYGEWLDFTILSFDQLDRIRVALIDPEYMDRRGDNFEILESRLIDTYKTKPTVNHYRGYELVWYTGHMLHEYGKYFQTGLRAGKLEKGKVFEGFQYGIANDNQIVPMVRFNDAKLEVVNKGQYEN